MFFCFSEVPTNIKLSAAADYTIQIDFEHPAKLYAEGPTVDLSIDKLYFHATCTLEGESTTLTGFVII